MPQSFSFSTGALKTSERVAAWNEQLEPLFEADPACAGSGFRAAMTGTVAGGMIVGTTHFSAQKFRRTPARVSRSNLDHYLVQIYTEGGCRGLAGGREFDLRSGDIVVFDLADTLATSAGDSSTLSLVLPRAGVDRHQHGIGHCNGLILPGRSALGEMLSAHLHKLVAALPLADAAATEHAAEATAALLASCLGASRPNADYCSAPLLDALRDRVMRYIDAHLGSPELSPDSICAALRMSRPHLYRACREYGGVARLIQTRRLRRAAIDLGRHDKRQQTIGAIALDCGFGSEAHFSRTFRETFGIRPRDARSAAAAVTDGNADDGRTLGFWLGQRAEEMRHSVKTA